MIFKKIRNPKKSSTKKERIYGLTNYILSPESTNHKEKCVYSNSRGFDTEKVKSQQMEMLALADSNPRSSDPISHYVFSWKEGEQPSGIQIEELVDIFLEEENLDGHQAIYGLHDDTENLHLHIAVNRIHPITEKAIEAGKGWDIEAGHKVAAKIAIKQGWGTEGNDLYAVLENGDVCRRKKEKSKKIAQEKIRIESKTGEKSAERIAIEQAAPILLKSKSWRELHLNLEKEGFRFERKGSGAIIFVGEIPIKASSIHRSASLGNLEKKLGPFEDRNSEGVTYYEHTPTQKLYSGQPRPLSGHRVRKLSQCHLAGNGERQTQSILSLDARAYRRGTKGVRWSNQSESTDGAGRDNRDGRRNRKPRDVAWTEYVIARGEYFEKKKLAQDELKNRHESERKALQVEQRTKREAATSGNWRGHGDKLNAIRSLVAARQAKEKLALKEKQAKERRELQKQFPSFPDLSEWLRGQKLPPLVNCISGEENNQEQTHPAPCDIRSFVAEVQGGAVHYSTGEELEPAFVDRGRRIDVYETHQREHVLAALQLATQKWGGLHINGSDDYKALCVQLAAEHGFKILNPELRPLVEEKREQIQQARKEAMKTEQLRQFEAYHEAVGADRYRVTSIRMDEADGKRAWILDKKDGVTHGFLPGELVPKIPTMLRLQKRGENIYYTPLSETKHHILIDDMSRENVNRLINDGYRPAVLLESSPENFQCIITIPKLGGPYDKDVGNRLTERLNKEYGDPNLSGCIHPHRAPGFENRKAKHQKEDGTYPEVKLLKAEKRECPKCLERAREIEQEYRQLAIERQARKEREQNRSRRAWDTPGSPTAAYHAHLDNIRQHLQIEDRSRVDAMIAVRMRVTGHSQAAVETAIRECAPALREGENRNWARYAERTAEYAFGLKGDEALQRNEQYADFWKKLEGRELLKSRVRMR